VRRENQRHGAEGAVFYVRSVSAQAAASYLKLIDGIGAEEPLVGDRAIAIVDYDFRRLVGLGQPNRFRDRILAAGKVGPWMIFPLFC